MTKEEIIEFCEMKAEFEAENEDIYEAIIKALEKQPSEDTEVIKVSKGALKARQGRFIIYDIEWLKKNFYVTEEKIYGQPKEPCEDCISRADVLGLAKKGVLISNGNYESVCKAINDLPSVTPKYTDEEIDRAQAVEQAYVDKMVELVAEEAKRPKGKWIKYQEPWGGMQGWKCSNCKNHYDVSSVYTIIPYNYCPNCGARMLQEDS